MGRMKTVDGDWVESGFLRTSADYEIGASLQAVWEIVADAGTWAEWHESLSLFETAGGVVLGPDVPFRSKEWVFNNEGLVNTWEAERAIGFTLTTSSFSSVYSRYAERIELKPGTSDNQCTVVHSGRIDLTLFGWILAGYVLGQALGAMYFDYRASTRNLAELAEARAYSSAKRSTP